MRHQFGTTCDDRCVSATFSADRDEPCSCCCPDGAEPSGVQPGGGFQRHPWGARGPAVRDQAVLAPRASAVGAGHACGSLPVAGGVGGHRKSAHMAGPRSGQGSGGAVRQRGHFRKRGDRHRIASPIDGALTNPAMAHAKAVVRSCRSKYRLTAWREPDAKRSYVVHNGRGPLSAATLVTPTRIELVFSP